MSIRMVSEFSLSRQLYYVSYDYQPHANIVPKRILFISFLGVIDEIKHLVWFPKNEMQSEQPQNILNENINQAL